MSEGAEIASEDSDDGFEGPFSNPFDARQLVPAGERRRRRMAEEIALDDPPPLRFLTERLVLREFREGDWPAILRYQQRPEFLTYSSWDRRTETNARSFVQRFVDWQSESPRFRFQLAVTLAGDDEPIGNVGVRLNAPGSSAADIGFELSPDYWGRGYATEAARAMLRFAFEDLRLHRVAAHCVADNTASARVLRKLGMKEEGRLRDAGHFKDRYWDLLLFAVLESD
jgi:[ribosomal protein S5]-alanine N-acetyltransferase